MRYTQRGHGDFTPEFNDEPERFLTQEQETDFKIDVVALIADTNKTTKTDLFIEMLSDKHSALPSIEFMLDVRKELIEARQIAYERFFDEHAKPATLEVDYAQFYDKA